MIERLSPQPGVPTPGCQWRSDDPMLIERSRDEFDNSFNVLAGGC